MAIRAAVESLQLEMAQRSLMNFYKRARQFIESEGGVFKHRKFEGEVPIAQYGPNGDVIEEESADLDEDGSEED